MDAAALARARAAEGRAARRASAQRNGALAYRAALLVRADSHRTTRAQLARRARRLGRSRTRRRATSFPQLHLLAAGVDPRYDLASEKHHGSAAAACRAVADGDADVCAHYISDAAGAARDDGWKLARLELRQSLGDARRPASCASSTSPIRFRPTAWCWRRRSTAACKRPLRDALLSLARRRRRRARPRALTQADRLMPVTGDVVKIIARLRAHVPQR